MTETTVDRRFPHLPPGREPGPQSRRHRTGARIAFILLGLLGILFLGLAVYALVAGIAVLALVFLALLAVTALGLQWLRRRANPAGLPHLDLTTDGDEKRRGEAITVALRISSPDAVKGERLELGLICTEHYDYEQVTRSGNGVQRSRQTRKVTAHEDWREVDPAAPEQSVSFPIPPQAPFSYEGDCVSYAWQVVAREVRPRRADGREDRPIWVLP